MRVPRVGSPNVFLARSANSKNRSGTEGDNCGSVYAAFNRNIKNGAVKLKTWQLLFYVPNLNWYQRQSFNLVCIANKPHHFEGQIEAKTCHENHSIF